VGTSIQQLGKLVFIDNCVLIFYGETNINSSSQKRNLFSALSQEITAGIMGTIAFGEMAL